jgi:hypothetical protein
MDQLAQALELLMMMMILSPSRAVTPPFNVIATPRTCNLSNQAFVADVMICVQGMSCLIWPL